ncbi:flavodoxin family protein [Bacteroidota bacterium]
MRITIYNANTSANADALNSYVEDITHELQRHHDVRRIILRNHDLNYCNGCWNCWVKTPGKCVIKDDMEQVLQSFINSDLVIFASTMTMGFPSSLMKKVNDRLIPLVHPYITLVNDECHHVERYSSYPDWGLILQKEANGKESDIELVESIYRRTALNIKSELKFTCTIDKPATEFVDEMNTIFSNHKQLENEVNYI